MTARELAEQLAVSMRTVYRDIEALCEAGVPIHMERGPLGGIVLADDYRRAIAQFTDEELEALFAIGPGPMSDIGVIAQSTALQKLRGALPAKQRRAAESSRERLFVDQQRWRGGGDQPTEILGRLRKAVEGSRSVRMQYRDRNGSLTERRVDPLGLVAKAGVWYLIALDNEKGYRTFRAQRIAGVDELRETFERPAGFNLEAYWNDTVASMAGHASQSSYDVVFRIKTTDVIKLSPYWDVVIVDAGAAASTLRIAFPNEEMAVVQLLALGDDVEIVSPPELPRAIVDRARRAIDVHSRLAARCCRPHRMS